MTNKKIREVKYKNKLSKPDPELEDISFKNKNRNLREDIRTIIQEDNESSSCSSVRIDFKKQKIEPKGDISSRITNVFSNHNKPQQAEDPSKYQNPLKNLTENNTPTILNSFLFVENTKKDSTQPNIEAEKQRKPARNNNARPMDDELFEAKKKDQALKRSYISTISAKFNPDILCGNVFGKKEFVRGNEYFTEKKGQKSDSTPSQKQEKSQKSSKEEGEESGDQSEEDKDDEDGNAYDHLKNLKSTRYWAEENPTIKCHNCWQFGHMQRDCPNETKRQNCILCGKDTHESFDCNEKMCFKCNRVGHQARECTAKNIDQCKKCNSIGHNEKRCLKIWQEPNSKKMQFFACIECGEFGHIKCFKEAQSQKIKIDAKVINDLDEFISQKFREAEISESEENEDANKNDIDAFDYIKKTDNQKKKKSKKLTKSQKRQKQMFLNDSSNVLMPSSEDEYGSSSEYNSEYGSDYDMDRRIFGNKNAEQTDEREYQIFCCICAGKHSETACPNKQYSRSQQFNSVRDKYANAVNFKPAGDRYSDPQYDRGYNRYSDNNNGNTKQYSGQPQYDHRKSYHSNTNTNNGRDNRNQYYSNDQRNQNYDTNYSKSPKRYTDWGSQRQVHNDNVQPGGRNSYNDNDNYRSKSNKNGYNHRSDMDYKYLNNQSGGSYNSNNSGYNRKSSSYRY